MQGFKRQKPVRKIKVWWSCCSVAVLAYCTWSYEGQREENWTVNWRVSQCLSFRFVFVTCPSLAVHVGLWNGVDWMVGFVFLFLSSALNACNRTRPRRLHGSLRSAKCWANGRHRQVLLVMMEQIIVKGRHIHNCPEMDFNSLARTLHVQWSREKRGAGSRQKPIMQQRASVDVPVIIISSESLCQQHLKYHPVH